MKTRQGSAFAKNSRTERLKTNKKHTIRPWHTLIAGFMAGVAVTLCVQTISEKKTVADIHQISKKNTSEIVENKVVTPEKNQDKPEFSKNSNTRPVFDFYTQLSRKTNSYSHDFSSDNNKSGKTITNEKAKQINNTSTFKTSTTPQKQTTSIKKGAYMIQAASLKTQALAEKLQKDIKKWGLNGEISTVTGKKGTWYRVQTGPFANKKIAEEAHALLALRGLNGLLIKL